MRKVLILLTLDLAACASPRKVEQRVSYERRDTLRACLGEELTVRLDDVKILSLDSPGRQVEAKVMRVERRRRAEVEATSCDSVGVEAQQHVDTREIAPRRSGGVPVWWLVLTAVAAYVIGAFRGRR